MDADTTGLIVVLVLTWYGFGISGFVYWWTSAHDLHTGDAIFALVVGLLGPFAWLVGWDLYRGKGPPRVIMKQRSRQR